MSLQHGDFAVIRKAPQSHPHNGMVIRVIKVFDHADYGSPMVIPYYRQGASEPYPPPYLFVDDLEGLDCEDCGGDIALIRNAIKEDEYPHIYTCRSCGKQGRVDGLYAASRRLLWTLILPQRRHHHER